MNCQPLNKEWNNIHLCFLTYFLSYSVLLLSSPVYGVGLFHIWGRNLSLVLVHLPRFKINLKTLLLFLFSSQLFCSNNSHPNVILWHNTQTGILRAALYLVKSEAATLGAERARRFIDFVIHKALHIEMHHLRSQSLLEVSLWPLNEVKIFGVEGRPAPRELIMKLQM